MNSTAEEPAVVFDTFVNVSHVAHSGYLRTNIFYFTEYK